MKPAFFFFLTALLFACNNANNTTAGDAANDGSVHAGAADTIVTDAQPLVLSGCYEMTLKKDSFFLELEVADTIVTGTLLFNFFEKDRNQGTLQGVLRNDRILADYTFRSEGVTSVREVIFLIQDGTLVQGHGELEEKNGKLVFTDIENLQYQSANPFIKVPCPTQQVSQ